MSDVRSVPLDRSQALLLEEIGIALLRNGDNERGTKVLAIALAWQGSRGIEDVLFPEPDPDSNVVELHGWSRRVGA